MDRNSSTGQLRLVQDHEARSTGANGGPQADGGLARALLRFPLFYKILIANAVIVVMVAVGCAALTTGAEGGGPRHFALLLAGGLAVSLVSNAVLLRVALIPLDRLERTAERVQAGDLTARVESSELADARLERLMHTFNVMLDSGEAYRGRLREIAARALNATEEERKRIARELHDGTAQTMAALRVRLRLARGVTDEEVRNSMLDRVSAEIGDATEEIRRIAQGLRPPALDMLGLAPAIESLARAIAETTGITVDTDIDGVEGLLPAETELALFRIIQEALSNVARHSGARRAWIRMHVAGQEVIAVIEDDGRGFSMGEAMVRGGLGLFGMQERGAYVGGEVAFDSAPAAGTRVRVTIPVAETARYA